MKSVSNEKLTFHDGREKANIIMLFIIFILVFLANLCLLAAKTSQYLIIQETSANMKKLGNMFLFAAILLFMVVYVVDVILQFSEDVTRPVYYAVYDNFESKIKLLFITALILNALLYV